MSHRHVHCMPSWHCTFDCAPATMRSLSNVDFAIAISACSRLLCLPTVSYAHTAGFCNVQQRVAFNFLPPVLHVHRCCVRARISRLHLHTEVTVGVDAHLLHQLTHYSKTW